MNASKQRWKFSYKLNPLRASWPIKPALISGFCSAKRIRIFDSSGRSTNPSQVSSQEFLKGWKTEVSKKIAQMFKSRQSRGWNWWPSDRKADLTNCTKYSRPSHLCIYQKVSGLGPVHWFELDFTLYSFSKWWISSTN